MDKQTLSNYGWIVVTVLVLAVLLALATPFSGFIAGAFKSTYVGFGNVTDKAFDVIGLDKVTPDDGDETEAPIEPVENAIPDGGIYYVGVGETDMGDYTGATEIFVGDGVSVAFPETVNTGDVYVYGDYEYRYNLYYYAGWWVIEETQDGWGARVIDSTKTSYGDVLETINGAYITSLNQTFASCSELEVAPKLPSKTTTLEATFWYCEALKQAPKIPSGVTNMIRTFHNCSSLTTAPVIPEGVTNMDYTFYNCAFTKAPAIPSTVTSMEYTFGWCVNLTDISDVVIPEGLEVMVRTFYYCTSLTNVPEIHKNVTHLTDAFLGCENLLTAPDLSACTKLTYLIGTFSGCTSLTTAPRLPDSLQDVRNAFTGCTSLTGTVELNGNITTYASCFSGVDFQAQHLTLTGSCSKIDNLGRTGINYCNDCNGYCTCGNY